MPTDQTEKLLNDQLNAERAEILSCLWTVLLPQLPDDLLRVDNFLRPAVQTAERELPDEEELVRAGLDHYEQLPAGAKAHMEIETGAPVTREMLTEIFRQTARNLFPMSSKIDLSDEQNIHDALAAKGFNPRLAQGAIALVGLKTMRIDPMILHSAAMALSLLAKRHARELRRRNQDAIVYLHFTEESTPAIGKISRNQAVTDIGGSCQTLHPALAEGLFDWTAGVLKTVPSYLKDLEARIDSGKNYFELTVSKQDAPEGAHTPYRTSWKARTPGVSAATPI